MTPTVPAPRFTPLHDVHAQAGATFTDFAGWQMPVRYASELAEHHAVRTAAGLFDLSHMAEIIITGPEGGAFLDYALSGRLSTMTVGQARYSLLLSPEGGIIDDVIVYRLDEHRFGVVANAGNRFEAAGALSSRSANFDARVIDESDEIFLLAVQGPASADILRALTSFDIAPAATELGYYRCLMGSYAGQEAMIARTGYTGEDGFELYVRKNVDTLWVELLAAGADHGLIPAGLGSRDTLRLEAGMPLYGHELGTDVLPVQAGLGRVVATSKDVDFVGRAAVEAGPAPDAPVLVGLSMEGRRAARAGYPVLAEPDGPPIGTVTSGALSPTLGHPIAMAFVHPDHREPGTRLVVDVRGKPLPASVVPLPFYTRKATS